MGECISVIVPVYKVEKYLNRCIESVVAQTYENIEIIIVDDGSPDKCPQICDEWKNKDSRIQVIHKKNGGLSSARNMGIHMATGEYILFVDSDDCIVSDACEKLYAYANGVDLVVAEATIYENGKIIHRVHTNLKENYIYSGTECAMKEIKAGEWFAAACYNMYKREFIIKNKLFFLEGILHEDIDYLPRLFLAAQTVKYMHYEFYEYIIRESSICSVKGEKNFNDLMNTYSRWKHLNECILDDKVKRIFDGELVKFYIATCREHRKIGVDYPYGITKSFLLRNTLNLKEFVKTVAFICVPNIYLKL